MEKKELVIIGEDISSISIREDIPLAVLFEADNVDIVLAMIKEKAEEFQPDTSTPKGRKAIASMANTVAKSKTFLDSKRKELVSEWKDKAKLVDTEGKKIRETLDALKITVREPLTKWEEAEKLVVIEQNKILSTLTEHRLIPLDADVDVLREEIEKIKALDIDSGDIFSDWYVTATSRQNDAIALLEDRLVLKIKDNKDQAELKALKAEKAKNEEKAAAEKLEKEKKAAVEKIRLDAEKKAKEEAAKKIQDAKDAEAKAKKEKVEAAAKAKKEKVEAAAKVKKDKADAAAKAKKEKAEAVEKAKKEAAEKAEKIETNRKAKVESDRLEEERKAKDQKNRLKISNAIIKHLSTVTDNPSAVLAITKELIDGKVPNCKVTF